MLSEASSSGLARRTRYVANRFRVDEELEFPPTHKGHRALLRHQDAFLRAYGGPGNPYDGRVSVSKSSDAFRLTTTRAASCD